MILDDLHLIVDCLAHKGAIYDRLWAYYDGLQPLKYATEKLADIFKDIDARFTLNWAEVVVNSVMDRLEIDQPIVIGDDDTTTAVTAWWDDSGIALDADDVHLCTLVTGEAFMIVAENLDTGVRDAYYNDSRRCHILYDERDARRMRVAGKWWNDEDGRACLVLVYPDFVAWYRSPLTIQRICACLGDKKTLDAHEGFAPWAQHEGAYDDDFPSHVTPNEYRIIPFFHFRRETRAIKSELTPSILDLQDAINKLFSDMMVAAEYGAFRQRWIISNAEVGTLKNSPNAIWDIPAGDGVGQNTQVGEFNPADLSNFMGQIKDLSVSISKMSRTPQSFFFLGDRADPSGEALIAMEGTLNKKVTKYGKRFKLVWDKLLAFCWQDTRVKLQFSSPVTIQPMTQAQTRLTNVQAGIPITTQLRDEGWTPAELAQISSDRIYEATEKENLLSATLMASERRFDRE